MEKTKPFGKQHNGHIISGSISYANDIFGGETIEEITRVSCSVDGQDLAPSLLQRPFSSVAQAQEHLLNAAQTYIDMLP
jgi:hypothetical protein